MPDVVGLAGFGRSVHAQPSPIQPAADAALKPVIRTVHNSKSSPLDLWQRRAGHQLSEEDSRQIRENLCGFFRVLAEWDQARRAAGDEPEHNVNALGRPRNEGAL